MRIRNGHHWVVFLFIVLAVGGCDSGFGDRPRMVVFVVVDQLRGDLLERYDSLFTGGFRRLHDHGQRFLSATHDHARTETAAGHATLSTAVYPSRSGIVANDWLGRTSNGWEDVYCMEDTMSHILGQPTMEGRSPKNLLRTGLADWIAEAESGAIIVSASRKDRGAINMAGKAKGHVYWIPESEAKWVTSSYYADTYPGWVNRLNRNEMPRIFGDSIWEQTMPPAARSASRPDTSQFERDGVNTFFPHRFHNEVRDPTEPKALNRWAYTKLAPDAALGVFAIEAIRSLDMGKDQITDYLGLSFSQTDKIGHDYGPNSREQLENLLHLDSVLGELMTVLDEEVGEGSWVMALTGDHGTLTIPEHLLEEGRFGRRATRADFSAVRSVFQGFRENGSDGQSETDSLVAALEELSFVARAHPVIEITTPPQPDSFAVLMRNSYHPDRWAWGHGSQGSGVVFRFVEGFYDSSSRLGTGHGSPYYYDRHVPLMFFGPGVAAGVSADPVRSVDVAPTLAALAGIPMPTDLDGRPLLR